MKLLKRMHRCSESFATSVACLHCLWWPLAASCLARLPSPKLWLLQPQQWQSQNRELEQHDSRKDTLVTHRQANHPETTRSLVLTTRLFDSQLMNSKLSLVISYGQDGGFEACKALSELLRCFLFNARCRFASRLPSKAGLRIV